MACYKVNSTFINMSVHSRPKGISGVTVIFKIGEFKRTTRKFAYPLTFRHRASYI